MAFVPKHLYNEFPEESRRLLHNPRICRLVAGLQPEQFQELDSASAVYWKAYTWISNVVRKDDSIDNEPTGLIDDGLKVKEARPLGWHKVDSQPKHTPVNRVHQVRLALDMIGAIAFKMVFPLNKDLEPLKKGESVQLLKPQDKIGGNAGYFLKRVGKYLRRRRAYFWSSERKQISLDYWTDDLECLRAMNSIGLDHLTFNNLDFTTGNSSIQFTNPTVRNFFAACWILRWYNEADRKWLLQAYPDPLNDTKADYAEFWNFVIGLAELNQRLKSKPQGKSLIAPTQGTRYWEIFAPIYDRSLGLVDSDGKTFRSTEMIYRTWDLMRGSASRREFESEFKNILNGEDGAHSQYIAKELLASNGENNFFSLCEERCEGDVGVFVMGEDRYGTSHEVVLSHYRLHRFCVQNIEFELFESRRKLIREYADKEHFTAIDFSLHPVVNVSWYDSICFALWLGVIRSNDGREYRVTLPTEAEWEYACRCGQTTPYTWSTGQDGNKIDSSCCNCEEILDRTSSVDGSGEERLRIKPNIWGFYQMHGNVWEWCWDWYDYYFYKKSPREDPVGPDTPSIKGVWRVQRGGSWIRSNSDCKSCQRSWATPSEGDKYSGIRLAAIPIERSR